MNPPFFFRFFPHLFIPTLRRTQSHTHITDNLEKLISLQCMTLGLGRKPEYPEEQGEHAGSSHTDSSHQFQFSN